MAIKKIAILASGGNSPGMNNVVITLLRKAHIYNWEVELIYDGYAGLCCNNFHEPKLKALSYFYANGNIAIGTSRFPEFQQEEYQEVAMKNLKEHKIDCLFVIGGNGSYQGALNLAKKGMQVVCLPGTIDNDVQNTEMTICYSTALNTVVRGIDEIRACFDSHSGVCIVEVMGRRFPDLTVNAAIATEAEAVVTPDTILDAKQMAQIATASSLNGHRSCIIVVTELTYGRNGLPTLDQLAKDMSKLLNGRMVRYDVLGYVQRGATPTAEDRILGNKMASFAIDYVNNNKLNVCIAVKNGRIVAVDLVETLKQKAKEFDNTSLNDYKKYCKY